MGRNGIVEDAGRIAEQRDGVKDYIQDKLRLNSDQNSIYSNESAGSKNMSSAKTPIIEWLFFQYYDKKTGKLSKTVMTLEDVQNAIRHFKGKFGSTLSDKNPANFMKDIVRGQNASRNWPEPLTKLKWTAIQCPGDGNVFEFVRFSPNQTEPFPDRYKATINTPRSLVQSVSLPLYSRTLGRADEPWLIQTAINLRIVETHMAGGTQLPILQIIHLQMSLKLRQTEIDAMFLALFGDYTSPQRAIITCEAKQSRERILDQQIINQVRAAFEETDVPIVIPIALRAVKDEGYYVVEFEQVSRDNAKTLNQLAVYRDAVYTLQPSVEGI